MLKAIRIPLTPRRRWCQRGFRDTSGFVGTVWQAFGEKMNPLLKQSMTYLLSPFALPRSRLENYRVKAIGCYSSAPGGAFKPLFMPLGRTPVHGMDKNCLSQK